MSILNALPLRITDYGGRPIAFGLAYFYAAGTSNLVEVFSDSGLTVPLSNPVLAGGPENPGMLPPVYLDPGISYHITYTDASGVTLFDVDDVEGVAIARTPVVTVNAQSRVYDLADVGTVVRRTYTSAMSDQLSAAAAVANGYIVDILNSTSIYDDTITVTGGGTINGASSLVLKPGQRVRLLSDGTGYISTTPALTTGYRDQSVPAAAWATRPVNGATYAQTAYATNNIAVPVWQFANAAEQGICFRFRLPKSYDNQPIQYSVSWGSAGGTTGQTVIFGMSGRVLSNGGLIDQSYGTRVQVTDSLFANNAVSYSPSGTFTPAAPGGVDLGNRILQLEFYRANGGGQTLLQTVYVDEISLKIGLNRGNDA